MLCPLVNGGDPPANKKSVWVEGGLKTARKVSVLKNDGLAARLKGTLKINLHVVCRKRYTHHVDLVSTLTATVIDFRRVLPSSLFRAQRNRKSTLSALLEQIPIFWPCLSIYVHQLLTQA